MKNFTEVSNKNYTLSYEEFEQKALTIVKWNISNNIHVLYNVQHKRES